MIWTALLLASLTPSAAVPPADLQTQRKLDLGDAVEGVYEGDVISDARVRRSPV